MFNIRISGIREIITSLLLMISGAYCYSLTALSSRSLTAKQVATEKF